MNAKVFIGVCLLLATVASALDGVRYSVDKLLEHLFRLDDHLQQLIDAIIVDHPTRESCNAMERSDFERYSQFHATITTCENYQEFLEYEEVLVPGQEGSEKMKGAPLKVWQVCKKLMHGEDPIFELDENYFPDDQSKKCDKSLSELMEFAPSDSISELLASALKTLEGLYGKDKLIAAITADHPNLESWKSMWPKNFEKYDGLVDKDKPNMCKKFYAILRQISGRESLSVCEARELSGAMGELADKIRIICEKLVTP